MAKKDDDVNYASMKIRCKDNNLIPFLYRKMKSTKHFENILLILIDQDYTQNGGANFKYLTNGDVMRAVLCDNEGGKNAEKVKMIKEFYKDNELMNSLIQVSKTLKVHNLVEQIKEVKKNYKSFFAKIKNGDVNARPPKPKKISKMNNVTLYTDGHKAFSYKTKKKSYIGKRIGINLDFKMRYIYLPHKYITNVVGSMENVKNININYSNGNFYFLVNYVKEKLSKSEHLTEKWAGIDPGLDNLMSIFIDDKSSKSLILDGANFVDYNVKSNRFIAKISSEIQYNRNLPKEQVEGLNIDDEIAKLTRFRKFLYEKRNNYFFSEFHKMSVRLLEYLQKCGVTHLAIPSNLAYLKNNGNLNLNGAVQQNFVQIPFMQLIKNIQYKAHKYGITVDIIDEAFTSKTSCLSQDINAVRYTFNAFPNLWSLIKSDSALSANVFKGRRAKRSKKESKGHRGDFYDSNKNVFINSDLNGAANICRIGKGKELQSLQYHKLCNPLKINSDSKFTTLLRAVQ